MKLATMSLAVALLAFALPAPSFAQQAQEQDGDDAEYGQPSSSRTGTRNYTGGRFTVDLAGHNVGLVKPVGAQEEPPVIQDPNARAAIAVNPSVAVRPGAVVTAPAAEDDDAD